jgi:Putative transposase
MERMRKEGAALVYRCAKQHSEPTGDKRGAKVDELTLTPLELIERIAALVPPPRTHRHRYFGVLAPNSPLRAAAVAMAAPAQAMPAQTGASERVPSVGAARQRCPTHARSRAAQARAGALPVGGFDRTYLQSFPAGVPDVRRADASDRVHYRGRADQEDPGPHRGRLRAPRISPARGPPLWDDCDAQMHEGVEIEPDWDLAAQPAPNYEVDQRVNW